MAEKLFDILNQELPTLTSLQNTPEAADGHISATPYKNEFWIVKFYCLILS